LLMGGESLPNNRWENSDAEVRRASTSRAYTDGGQTLGVRVPQAAIWTRWLGVPAPAVDGPNQPTLEPHKKMTRIPLTGADWYRASREWMWLPC